MNPRTSKPRVTSLTPVGRANKTMIIWITSYPKSGNTWIRSLLGAYLYSDNGIFNFNLINKIDQFPGKQHFEFFLKDFKDIKKVSNNWIAAQDRLNLSNDGTIFLKTHNALCTIDNNPFTNKNNTRAAIYVVRDPRNVITSLSHHYNMNIEESFNFLTDSKINLVNKKLDSSVVTPLGDWSNHYQSWRKHKFAPLLIVKYEDLIIDVKKTFLSILNFLKNFMDIKIEENKVLRTIESCSFDRLSKNEEIEGFNEAVYYKNNDKKLKFFYLGKKNNWRNLLDPVIEKKVRKAFKGSMKELGYT